jgi:hypothetical protein
VKLQCACGAKYSFELTPEMVGQPVQFVCPSCGQDSSDVINELVRREFAGLSPVAEPPPRLRVAAPATADLPATETSASKYCERHRGETAQDDCTVCKKPICTKCLEEFGVFCSPLCRNKADLQGIVAPAFAGQKFAVEARFWRRTGLIAGLVSVLVLIALGGWIWYAWFGSVPHPIFSVRFDGTAPAHSGQSQLVDPNQLVFLHGGTLARYDLKTRQRVWSEELVTEAQVAEQLKSEEAEIARASADDSGGYVHHPSADERENLVRDRLQGELTLRISGQNVWVGKPVQLPAQNPDHDPVPACRLTHYDWTDGRALQELILPAGQSRMISSGDELLVLTPTVIGTQFVTHVNLASGETRLEQFQPPGVASLAGNASDGSDRRTPTGGLPLTPGADTRQTLDPQQVAGEAQNLKLPGRLALPALLANATHEQQLEAALRDSEPQMNHQPGQPNPQITGRYTLIPTLNGYLQFGVRRVEEHFVTRDAMKAPPKKSVLDDPGLNVTQTSAVANETLNEMQRASGGGTVTEDLSLYEVTLRRPDSPDLADWTGMVTGRPAIFPLRTVNVLTAGKTISVFDTSNKKLWEASLTHDVQAGNLPAYLENPRFGAGPCVEQGDSLYVFDQAMLTAYDLATGIARWRLPSVGVVGLFFDDQGMLYVNTTSANPDDIRYARQIDITRAIDNILIKVDPRSGRTLWSIKPGGFISYVSGKFIYTMQSYDPNPTDQAELSDALSGLEKPPYLRIARIRPADGRILWEHYQERCPVNVQFHENSIELIFKKEVQVLRYLTF